MDPLTCPKCHGAMRQYERSDVTVDQCTECRGIFLDRGELERLIDAEHAWFTGPEGPYAGAGPEGPYAGAGPEGPYGGAGPDGAYGNAAWEQGAPAWGSAPAWDQAPPPPAHQAPPPQAPPHQARQAPPQGPSAPYGHPDPHGAYGGGYARPPATTYGRRRKSFLEQLFD